MATTAVNGGAVNARAKTPVRCVAAICSQAQVVKFERPSDHAKNASPLHSSSQAPAASVFETQHSGGNKYDVRR